MQEQELKTISLDGSHLTWDKIDSRAKQLNLNRSKYTQQLYEKDLQPKKIKDHTVEIFFGIIFALQLFLIIIILGG